MNKEIIKLSDQKILSLKSMNQSLYFKNDFDLIYEYQIPIMGILFLDGEMSLVKRKKIQAPIDQGSLIGIHNIINNTPLSVGVKVSKNSTLLMIEKSSIIEALSQKSGILYQIISES